MSADGSGIPRLTPQGEYSHTPPDEAEYISLILRSYFPQQKVHPAITDGTAGRGCNAINFAKYFEHVTAVEIDNTEFNVLQENVRRSPNITCVHDDITKYFSAHQTPILFLDPPWGGPAYKQFSKVNLSLSGQDICAVIQPLLSSRPIPIIGIKVPVNYDDINMREMAREMNVRCDIYEIWRKNYISYNFMVLTNNYSHHPLRVHMHRYNSRSFYSGFYNKRFGTTSQLPSDWVESRMAEKGETPSEE